MKYSNSLLYLLLFTSGQRVAYGRDSKTHNFYYSARSAGSQLKNRRRTSVPLIISNQCTETIYPGILTQAGQGPGTGGFQLVPGDSNTLTVGTSWQGRVWGRTNCSFDGGTSYSSDGRTCTTGDCGGLVSCQGAGQTPVNLAEFTLDPTSGQTFYDLSLVDGYNLPMAIVLQPLSNSGFDSIPPSLTNPSCVATAGDLAPQGFDPYSNGAFLGTNASDPLPFDESVSVSEVASWCPSDLEFSKSAGPLSGVYTYPDGNLQRPPFDPCFSACAKFDQAQYCCTGSFDSPSSCKPSQYSEAAKKVCPDAYSYAFDDQTSTFIIPAGAGFEVIFCPGGRSTNILATSKSKLIQLAQQGQKSNTSTRKSSLHNGFSSSRRENDHAKHTQNITSVEDQTAQGPLSNAQPVRSTLPEGKTPTLAMAKASICPHTEAQIAAPDSECNLLEERKEVLEPQRPSAGPDLFCVSQTGLLKENEFPRPNKTLERSASGIGFSTTNLIPGRKLSIGVSVLIGLMNV